MARTVPATRTAQTIAQVKNVLRRLRAAGHGRKAAPLFVFDAGYSAAALADGLLGCPVHVLVRLAAGCVFYAEPVTWEGKYGRPPAAGRRCTAWSRRTSPLPPRQRPPGPEEAPAAEPGTRTRHSSCPIPRSTAPSGPRPGTACTPSSTATAAGSPDGRNLPVLPGTLVHVTVERLPDGRDPHRAMWLWHAGPGPLSLDELWRAYLARFDIEHAFKLLKGTLGLTAAKVRAPEQADRWVRLLMAAHAQLLLARPLAADLRRPWEKHPDPARPLTPGRVRRGFRNIRRDLGTPARVAKPSRPGPGRPKGSSKGPAPRYLLPGEADMPRTAKPALTREKVKT